MGKVAIEGMKFYAYHGYYEEEQLIGNEYVVDIYMDTNFAKAANGDDLEGTINYENVYRIVKMEMQKKSKLLEAVAQRIINRLKSVFDTMETLTVRISKLNPPIGGEVQRVWIESTENYSVKCAKCGKMFLSHLKDDNWTKHGQIYPETRATLTRTYGSMICKACLEPHFIKPKS